ncbi:MAG: TetR/AcrR family transcriptional regulator [Ottowia sp.]|uniref:TetR/AcrR family transcriptional regulator n=1 Tax=unclassified Ottowia TaxID=2645081 RepID=UPI003C2D4F86
MARAKEFDVDHALDAAVGVFREHGYAGASAGMLTSAMGIGRQSLYDTFGDKWALYCAAVRRYGDFECRAHLYALGRGPKAIDGLRAMVERVVAEARTPCLGVYSVTEFGGSSDELVSLREGLGEVLAEAVGEKIRQAQAQGDVDPLLDAAQAAAFLVANIAAIRIAARGGADDAQLQALGQMVLRVLR